MARATTGPEAWGQSFGYDPWGNLLSVTVTQGSAPMLTVGANDQNQIPGYSYDAAGNVLANAGLSYSWNAEGETKSAGNVTYLYDGDGRRVEKSTGKLYWYGMSSEPLVETDGAGNNPVEYVFFDGKRIARRDSSGKVDYYLADHLGSSRVVTDSAGNILDDCDFLPFGGTTCAAGPTSGNTYDFTGKERDSESGNDYFGASYYTNILGRFMGPDPLNRISLTGSAFTAYLANPQHWDRYVYALDNPTTFTDPTGLNACGSQVDDGCQVTVKLTDRTKDKNGNYNDQFTKEENQQNYNATATVKVNGKVRGVFLARTVPSDSKKYATIANGTYKATLGRHDGQPALRLNGGGEIPIVGGIDPLTKLHFATGILAHAAGRGNRTGMYFNSRAKQIHGVSEGCQLICTSQYNGFLRAIGVVGQVGPPQNDFTVTVDTEENLP